MDFPVPLHVHDESFCVRAYESGVSNQVTLPALCNYLQEAAGNHARALGLGIHELQDAGFTWMLARLHLAIHRYAAWRETVHLRTWPAGVRGRLTALRDFRMTDDAGETVLLGVSEWLYVEAAAQRIVRLPHPSFYRWMNQAIFQVPERLRIIGLGFHQPADAPAFERAR